MKFVISWTGVLLTLSRLAAATISMSNTIASDIARHTNQEDLFYTKVTDIERRENANLSERGWASMTISYWNDNACTKHAGNVGYDWGSKEGFGTANCFNYQYGKSVNIAACFGASKHCRCEFYREVNCGNT